MSKQKKDKMKDLKTMTVEDLLEEKHLLVEKSKHNESFGKDLFRFGLGAACVAAVFTAVSVVPGVIFLGLGGIVCGLGVANTVIGVKRYDLSKTIEEEIENRCNYNSKDDIINLVSKPAHNTELVKKSTKSISNSNDNDLTI